MKHIFMIPQSTLTVDEMAQAIVPFFKAGFAVKRGSVKIDGKTMRTIEIDDGREDNDVRKL